MDFLLFILIVIFLAVGVCAIGDNYYVIGFLCLFGAIVLIFGFVFSCKETKIVSENEYKLLELSTVSDNEYTHPHYIIGLSSPDNKDRQYQYWFRNEDGYTEMNSITMDEMFFNFESNGSSVIVTEVETSTLFYKVLTISTTTSKKYVFIVPEGCVYEKYNIEE